MIWDDQFTILYDELRELVDELNPYYDVDKVRWYTVYIWTKGNLDSDNANDWGQNVFDIQADEITFYLKDHIIIEEAKPIIEKIQAKLRELREQYLMEG